MKLFLCNSSDTREYHASKSKKSLIANYGSYDRISDVTCLYKIPVDRVIDHLKDQLIRPEMEILVALINEHNNNL